MMKRTHHDHVGFKFLGLSQKELADIATLKRETHHLRGNTVALQMRHHVLHRRLFVFPWVCRHADEQHHPLRLLEKNKGIVAGTRGLRAAVPSRNDGRRPHDGGWCRRNDDHWAARGEQATLDERILADQRIAVSRWPSTVMSAWRAQQANSRGNSSLTPCINLISMLTPSASQWALQS